MKLPFSSSIRLALAISALFVFLALLAGAVTYGLQTRAMSVQLAEDVKGLATGLAQIAGQGDRQDLIEQTMALSESVGGGSVVAVLRDPKTGERFGNANLASFRKGAQELAVGHDIQLKSPPASQAGSYLAFGVETPLGDILVGKDEGPLKENQRILLTTMGWGLGLALALAIGLALAIARVNEMRIARIGRVLDAVGDGNYKERIGPMGRDDLGHLAGMVDQTLDRLVAGIDAIRQVSTDVAHDLRAPLSRLRIRLEPLALSDRMPDDARHEVGSALNEIDAISATFSAILRLARLESGAAKPVTAQTDLSRLVLEIGDLFKSNPDGTCTIDIRVPDRPVIHPCDQELVSQAIVNLLHNCLQHCPHPVHISLELHRDGGEVVISVADNGAGIPPADRERVLKRFVRLDSSRRTPGTGLGLNLVAAVADLHGAHLELLDNLPGLRVNIRFPVL